MPRTPKVPHPTSSAARKRASHAERWQDFAFALLHDGVMHAIVRLPQDPDDGRGPVAMAMACIAEVEQDGVWNFTVPEGMENEGSPEFKATVIVRYDCP